MGPGSEGSRASWGSTRFIGVQRKLKFVFLFEGYGSKGNLRKTKQEEHPLGCCPGWCMLHWGRVAEVSHYHRHQAA